MAGTQYPGGYQAPHGPVQGSGRRTAAPGRRRVGRAVVSRARARARADAYAAYPEGTPTPGVGVGGPAVAADDYDPGGIVAWGPYRNPQPTAAIARAPAPGPITRTPVPAGRMVGAPVPAVPASLPLHQYAPQAMGPPVTQQPLPGGYHAQQMAFLEAIRRAMMRLQGGTVGL